MIDKIVYIAFLRYARRQKWIVFPERAVGAVIFLPKVLAALSVLHPFVGEDGFVQFQNTTEKVIGFIPLVLLILKALYIWHFSDREEKTAREVEQALRESPTKWKIRITLYYLGLMIFICIFLCCFPS